MLALSFLMMVLSAAAGILLGSSAITLPGFLKAFASGDFTAPAFRILIHVRLPRVLSAILAGGALAVSGAILQAVLNNPLAGPNVIGVNTGAGLMVLLCSALLPNETPLFPLAAFAGALMTSMVIYALSMVGGVSKITLILTGIAMSSILGAGMNCVMILNPDAYIGVSAFLVGGLAGVTLDSLAYPSLYIAAGLLASLFMRNDMNIIALGQDSARSLGMNVSRTRFLLILIASVLAGAAVSFAGLLGFVGLIIPHAVRFLTDSDNRYVVPTSIFMGASFVILCDLASRALFAPYELPVGIMLSFIGGPFFIYLIIKKRRENRD